MNPKIVFGVVLVGVAGAVVFVSFQQKEASKPSATPKPSSGSNSVVGFNPNVNPNLPKIDVSIATGYAGVNLKTVVIDQSNLKDNGGEFQYTGGY